jgi:hypothetical protein
MARAAVAALLLGSSLAACSGGSHPLPATTTAGASAAPAAVHFSLLIPAGVATASGRRAQYVSSSTLSGELIVNGNITVELNLGIGSPLCTAVSSGRTCLISTAAPIGSDSFKLTLYDGAYTNNAHSGNPLSAGSLFSVAVTEGSASLTVPLVLSGVPATYALNVTQQPTAYATTGSGSLGAAALDVYDIDGNLIVGPGGYIDTNGNAVTFTISSAPQNETIAINGGASALSGTVSAPSDTIAFTQTAISIGAELTAATAATVTQTGRAYVRPIGFNASTVESAQRSVEYYGMQLASAVGTTGGVVAFTLDSTPAFQTDDGVGGSYSCSGVDGRQSDLAYTSGTAWFTDASPQLNTFSFPTCSLNGQSGIGSVVTLWPQPGTGDLAAVELSCVGLTIEPGVYATYGTGSPSLCTYPHDITGDGGTTYALLYTNSGDTDDHLALYSNQNYTQSITMTSSGHTAAGSSLLSIGARSDGYYVEESLSGTSGYLWFLAHTPSATTATVQSATPLPAGVHFVVNTNRISPVADSNRSMAIGADGLAYIAISSPVNGLLVVDPATATTVATIPNVSGASTFAPFQVVADPRGTIYWSAGEYIMHYPSSIP